MGLATVNVQHSIYLVYRDMRTHRHEHSRGSALAQVEPLFRVSRDEHLEGRHDETGAKLSVCCRVKTEHYKRTEVYSTHLGNQNESVCSAYAERSCRTRIPYPRGDNKQRATDIALQYFMSMAINGGIR